MKKNGLNNAIALVAKVRHLANGYILEQLEARGYGDIATSHGDILSQLYRKKEMNMTELAQCIGRDKSTLTVLVRKLENLGYVERTISAEDQRVRLLRLTPKAEDFYPVFMEIAEGLNEKAFRDFEDYEIEMLRAILGRVIDNFGANSSNF